MDYTTYAGSGSLNCREKYGKEIDQIDREKCIRGQSIIKCKRDVCLFKHRSDQVQRVAQ